MRLVVFRLGRLIGLRGPGLVFLIPVIDQAVPIDLREQVIDVTKQTCITKDNAPVDIDLLIYLKVVDPEKVVTQVQNFRQAAVGIATTTLRAVVGDIELDEVLAKREYIDYFRARAIKMNLAYNHVDSQGYDERTYPGCAASIIKTLVS